ncbi:MAG: ABC-F family ATP-binding cassette domain-containing protein [Bacteroidetes bacterium]|nr:ABC-F family ATP-binding cassette domain-containing protein [Bacteroidota bacterium]
MNLLSVNLLSKSFGTKILFNKISFGINYGDKTAIVAKNGSGKTTLFKILKGIEIADEGQVVFRKDISIAFLDQDFVLDENKTIYQAIYEADNKYIKCIKNYEAALNSIEENNTSNVSLSLDEALHQMNDLNAWEYEKNIKEILSRLELNDLTIKISLLSGGQKKRLALALVLINKPDLIIMDEPTNHLDVEMIEWLEFYLQDSKLSLLLVTHDRYFLDEVCTSIIELENSEIVEYKGDFEYYLQKKAEREQIKSAEIDKAKNLYRRELEWVRKMPKARTTKSKSRVDAFYDIEQKAKQKKAENKIELSVKMERLGSKIVELHKVSKAFGNKKILTSFSHVFKNGEKVAIIGKNGVGKSTLLKLILSEISPDNGKISIGDTVIFGNYSQEGLKLNNDKRVIEVVKEIAEAIPMANGSTLTASALLTKFNFPPSDQYSFVKKLSGGEKRRLYLLTVLIKNPNFLILDEPTNDLDIVTLQTLEEFLLEFKGCVLIVSHDRYFVDKLVDHVFAFEGEGEVKDFPGNYSEYRIWKQSQKKSDLPESTNNANLTGNKKTETVKEVSKKLSYKLQKELEDIEKELPLLENKKNELENKLLILEQDYVSIEKISKEIEELKNLIDIKGIRWLEINE